MGNGKEMTFWDHLEELRTIIIRSLALLVILMVVAFFFKGFIFDSVVLPPLDSNFILYRLLNRILLFCRLGEVPPFHIELINIEMASQFFIHLRVSFYAALIVAMPFVFYELWTFIKPALYENEKNNLKKSFGFAALLFYLGVFVGYVLVLPLTVRFLGTYQVSFQVPNQISLSSYIGMFVSLVLIMGICFEMPVLAVLLSKFGLIDKAFLKKYRKHSFIIILIAAAVITPSGDAVTLFFVAVPLYLLYELSILVCKNSKELVADDIN